VLKRTASYDVATIGLLARQHALARKPWCVESQMASFDAASIRLLPTQQLGEGKEICFAVRIAAFAHHLGY
jgi:hypothetical protein